MTEATVSDEDFIHLFETLGAGKMAQQLGIDERNIYRRRRNLEQKLKRAIDAPTAEFRRGHRPHEYPHRLEFDIDDGVVLVGSDAHYWPGIITTAHRAFVHFAKKLKPKIVIANGDFLDGAGISRHPPIGWESRPSLQQEIETCQERLAEIAEAAGKADKVWTLGNHDARFETRLAAMVPEFAKIHGVHLHDHFPHWEPCWAVWVNEGRSSATVIKHRFKGGMHATHNNTLWAGVSMITGHDHNLRVTPFDDYHGIRFGASSGTLADAFGPQFTDYTEDGPRNQRSGFLVLYYKGGRLLWPQACHVLEEGLVQFRGELIEV